MSAEATPTHAPTDTESPSDSGNAVHASIGSQHRYAVGLGLVAWFLTDLCAVGFSASLPGTMSDLGLPSDAAALPGAVVGLITTFAAVPMGWLADKLAAKKLLVIGLLLAVGANALALLGSGALFGLVALLVSFSAVLLPPVVIRLLTWLARDMRGVCIGVLLAMSGGQALDYLLLAFSFREAVDLGWRVTYLAALLATLLLAIHVMTTFRAPSIAADSHAGPTLSMRTMLHLCTAAIVLAAIAGGASQLEGRVVMELQEMKQGLRYTTVASFLHVLLTVLGATLAAFLYGPHARWLPWLTMGAAGVCFAALLVTAAAEGPVLAWYSLHVVQVFGGFAFALALSSCACWAAENTRGLLTGILFGGKLLLGAIFGAALLAVSGASSSSGPAWGLAVLGLALCAWSIVHAHRAQRVLSAPMAA